MFSVSSCGRLSVIVYFLSIHYVPSITRPSHSLKLMPHSSWWRVLSKQYISWYSCSIPLYFPDCRRVSIRPNSIRMRHKRSVSITHAPSLCIVHTSASLARSCIRRCRGRPNSNHLPYSCYCHRSLLVHLPSYTPSISFKISISCRYISPRYPQSK